MTVDANRHCGDGSLYIQRSNHYVVHPKLTCYTPITSQFKKNKKLTECALKR